MGTGSRTSSWWLLPRATLGLIILAACSLYLEYCVELATSNHAARFRRTQRIGPTTEHTVPGRLILFSASNWERIWFHFLTVTMAALAGIGLVALPNPENPPRWWCTLRSGARRVATQRLWPAKFWVYWCGGLNLAETLGVAIWLFIHAWYFQYLFKRYRSDVRNLVASGLHTGVTYDMLMLERVGLAFGIMMRPTLWMLFFPLPHVSFITRLTGLSWSKLIRYHRWMGQGLMIVFTFHTIPYWIYWAALPDVSFWTNFLDWSKRASINYLAGNLAFACGVLIWITGMDWCRRRYFEVFYRSHIIGASGFMIFCFMHYIGTWFMLLPGLIIYAVDLVFRAGQLAHTTPLSISSQSQEQGLMTIQMATEKDFHCTPAQNLFLQVPAIDRFSWHPFTCARFERQSDGRGLLTMHVKTYKDGWTKELWARALGKGQQLRGKVSGPFGPPIELGRRRWEQCSTVIMIAGGNGAVPLLAILNDLAERMPMGLAGNVQKVVLFWLSQSGEEFHILDPAMLSLAREGSWLDVNLYITRRPLLSLTRPSSGSDSPNIEQQKLLANQKQSDMDRVTEERGSMPGSAAGMADSPYGWRAAAVQPEMRGGLLEALVVCLVFLGAVAGSILPVAFNLEYQATTADKRLPKNLYSAYGLLLMTCQVIGALGLPYLLVIFPTHCWRAWRCQPAVSFSLSGTKLPCLNLDPMMPQLHMKRPSLQSAVEEVVARRDCPGPYALCVGGPGAMWELCQDLTLDMRRRGAEMTAFAETAWL